MPPLPKGMKEKISLGGVSRMSTNVLDASFACKTGCSSDAGSRRDLTSGLARVLSLVRIDVSCGCCYLGVIGVLLLFFFFGFSFLVQRPLSCSPTAARHFASLGQQGAVRRGAFLCA